jgi:hypothetical protein
MTRSAKLGSRHGQHGCLVKTIVLLELNKVFTEVGFPL